MCDHTIVDQTTALEVSSESVMPTQNVLLIKFILASSMICAMQGIYLEAFRRVFDILEDSGWSLVREKDKGEADESSLDDLPNLPYIKQL